MDSQVTRIAPVNAEMPGQIVVEWILSNICNYDCSYCPAYLHNGSTGFPKYDDIVKFCRRARSHYFDREMTLATVNRKIMFKDARKHPADYSAGQAGELEACLAAARHRPRGRVLKGTSLLSTSRLALAR